jgi:hypothetical protein
VRSASALIVACALALTGCVTTQRRNERYKLRADRTLASRRATVVRAPGADVAVTRVAGVRAARGGAIVVELANRTDRPLSDVPITVGVGRARLNARAGIDFFQTHIAAIPARGHVTWVFTTRRAIPHGRPFALVGSAARSPAHLPSISAALARSGAVVRNASDVPQYGMPVYAVASRGGRYVAAGRATVADLGGGAAAAVRLSLVGVRHGAPLQLEALPTIYR